jgi:hypothetical protein
MAHELEAKPLVIGATDAAFAEAAR